MKITRNDIRDMQDTQDRELWGNRPRARSRVTARRGKDQFYRTARLVVDVKIFGEAA